MLMFLYCSFKLAKLQCIAISVPTGVASIELESRTDTSLSVAWAEPQNTDLASYDVRISPNDGGETLPISVNRYVQCLYHL